MGGIALCSKLGFCGYGQIAQNCEKWKMFVQSVYADKFRDYIELFSRNEKIP